MPNPNFVPDSRRMSFPSRSDIFKRVANDIEVSRIAIARYYEKLIIACYIWQEWCGSKSVIDLWNPHRVSRLLNFLPFNYNIHIHSTPSVYKGSLISCVNRCCLERP